MFKLKFKQKMKPNFLLCLTLRRKTSVMFSKILSTFHHIKDLHYTASACSEHSVYFLEMLFIIFDNFHHAWCN